jgi:hypothetical protein
VIFVELYNHIIIFGKNRKAGGKYDRFSRPELYGYGKFSTVTENDRDGFTPA